MVKEGNKSKKKRRKMVNKREENLWQWIEKGRRKGVGEGDPVRPKQ